MSSDKLSRMRSALSIAGVGFGSRNKTVAEKTGYSVGTVNRILSGHANLTARFIQAVCIGFDIRREWIDEGELPVRKRPQQNLEALITDVHQGGDELIVDGQTVAMEDGKVSIGPLNKKLVLDKELIVEILGKMALSREERIGEIIEMMSKLTDEEVVRVHRSIRTIVNSHEIEKPE